MAVPKRKVSSARQNKRRSQFAQTVVSIRLRTEFVAAVAITMAEK